MPSAEKRMKELNEIMNITIFTLIGEDVFQVLHETGRLENMTNDDVEKIIIHLIDHFHIENWFDYILTHIQVLEDEKRI